MHESILFKHKKFQTSRSIKHLKCKKQLRFNLHFYKLNPKSILEPYLVVLLFVLVGNKIKHLTCIIFYNKKKTTKDILNQNKLKIWNPQQWMIYLISYHLMTRKKHGVACFQLESHEFCWVTSLFFFETK